MANDPFAGMRARAVEMQLAAEKHVETCALAECERCNRHLCGKCRTPVEHRGLCDSCERERDRARWVRLALEATPKAFAEASLDAAWLARLVGEKAIAEARQALGATRVVAVGPPGSGKTSLVTAMFLAADFQAARATVLHTSAYQLARARAVHPLGAGEAPLVARAFAATLLVLDELGGEEAAHQSAVKDVLHERHAQDQPTWVTTGVTPTEVATRYGGGIARRVFEDAKTFRLVGRTR